MDLDCSDWLQVVDRTYLQDFVAGGGAAVKVVVTRGPDDRTTLRSHLATSAQAHGFVTAAIDAAATRMSQIDQVFYELARQLDWEQLVADGLGRLLTGAGYVLPERLTLRALAAMNAREEVVLRQEVMRLLEAAVYRDAVMCREFRLAMFYLCLAMLEPDSPYAGLAPSLTDWLRGDLKRITALKPALIAQRIGRHNARHVLAALCHWLRLAGRTGLLLTLDAERLMTARSRSTPVEGLTYGPAGVMDAYEVLRQFIDGTDDLTGCLIVVLTGPAFLTDERRGLACYDALRMRLADDVHDRHRANPLAPLIRLVPSPAPAVRLEAVSHG